MKSDQNLKGGYIGLLVLFMGTALIIFFIIRTDIFSGKSGGKSIIEQKTDSINKAEESRNKIQIRSQEASEQ